MRAEITRPANTTAYAAGDVVAANAAVAPIQLTGIGRQASATGEITHVSLETNNATVTNGDFAIHFFRESFVLEADNAAWASLHANRANYLGFITLPTLLAKGGAAATKDDDLRIPFQCSTSGANLFVVIEAMGAYTPASGQVFSISVGAVVDP